MKKFLFIALVSCFGFAASAQEAPAKTCTKGEKSCCAKKTASLSTADATTTADGTAVKAAEKTPAKACAGQKTCTKGEKACCAKKTASTESSDATTTADGTAVKAAETTPKKACCAHPKPGCTKTADATKEEK